MSSPKKSQVFTMISYILAFLVMLNPFLVFVYVKDVREQLPDRDYYRVINKANILSFIVYIFFAVFGGYFFKSILQIKFESFRIFGGLIFVSTALVLMVHGKKSFVSLRGNLDDIASEVAIPFMVGPGTISISIIIGNDLAIYSAILIIGLAMLINYGIIYILSKMRKRVLDKSARKTFDKKLNVVLRLMGSFVGAIGINMIVIGLQNLYGL